MSHPPPELDHEQVVTKEDTANSDVVIPSRARLPAIVLPRCPVTSPDDLGPVYTRGASFRARAEARQREYRAHVLRVGWSQHGHWLDDRAAGEGRNFVVPEAMEEAQRRAGICQRG
jgi:hypothetical protein